MTEAATLAPGATRAPALPTELRAARDADRAHRRGHQRLGRGRAALRPVARRDRREDRQRHLDDRDHSRRDPAAGAQRRRRLGHPHPHRHEAGDQRRRRDRPRRRVQRAGAARPRAGRRVEARRADPAREHVARAPRPEDRRLLRRDGRHAEGGRLPRLRGPARARVPQAGRRSAQGQEHVRARDAVQPVQPRPEARPRADRAHVRQEGREGHPGQPGAVRRRLRLGRAQPRLQVPDSRGAIDRAADRRQRQHRAGAGRAGLRHGHLRDVPDHAGDVGLALPVRRVRAGRRHRPPGGGRDRRLRVRDRRLLRRQVRGDGHVGAGLLAEAGGHRARGDGRDPAGRHQRAARRAVHRPADQGRAGRPAHGDLRQPRRRAEGRDGGVGHRGLLLLDDHGAQDRRDVQHGRRRAVGREPLDRAAAVPAAAVRRRLARPAARPDAGSRGHRSPTTGTR